MKSVKLCLIPVRSIIPATVQEFSPITGLKPLWVKILTIYPQEGNGRCLCKELKIMVLEILKY